VSNQNETNPDQHGHSAGADPNGVNTADGDSAGADPTDPQADPVLQERRRFLNRLTLAVGAASATSIGWAIVAFIVAPVTEKTQSAWRSVGKEEDFQIGSTTVVTLRDASTVAWAGYAGRTAAWLRRDGKDNFTCFSVNCTHLGCPVRWEEGAELFMCPCHGGVYYKDGSVAAGPPPEPLPKYQVRLKDGNVQVLASPVPITRGV
jgi:menaquinol-cytochrome c reductase iron-sulfur subunit